MQLRKALVKAKFLEIRIVFLYQKKTLITELKFLRKVFVAIVEEFALKLKLERVGFIFEEIWFLLRYGKHFFFI